MDPSLIDNVVILPLVECNLNVTLKRLYKLNLYWTGITLVMALQYVDIHNTTAGRISIQ